MSQLLFFPEARQWGAHDVYQKKTTLIDWLKTLPYAQKIAFLGTLCDKTPELRDDLLTLIKEGVDGMRRRAESTTTGESPLLFQAKYKQLVETTTLLDPLLENGNANFQYDDGLSRYKELGDEKYQELVRKGDRRMELMRQASKSRKSR